MAFDLTEDEKAIFISNYGILTISEIQKLYFSRLTHSQVSKIPRILNLPKQTKPLKKHRANRNLYFFDNPNPICSYWAGYLAADGCIKENQYDRILKIASIDDYIINSFIKDTEYDGKIYNEKKIQKSKCEYSYIKNIIVYGINDNWYIPLNKIYGLHPRKTFTLEPPLGLDLNNSLSYIKGYIDGDGCISYHMRTNRTTISLTINVVGRKQILDWMIDTINLVTKADVKCRARQNIFTVDFVRSTAKNIYDILSNVVERGLPRKWNRFNNYDKIETYNQLPLDERRIIGLKNFKNSLDDGYYQIDK